MKVLPPQEAYRLWAPTYDQRENNAILFVEERTVRPLLDSIGLGNESVIDIGCGTGRHIGHLLDNGAASVTGVDLSMEMLSLASAKFQTTKNVALMQARMECIPLRDKSFDAGITSLALSHIRALDSVLVEIARLLRTGGHLVIADLHWSFSNRGWYRTFPTHRRQFRQLAVQHFTHTPSDYKIAFDAAGFAVDQCHEPVIDASVQSIFERSNMQHVYEQYCGQPLLVAFLLHKL